MSVKYLYLFAAVGLIGCASAAPRGDIKYRANELTSAEIAAAHADVLSVFDAVQRLRPNWLAVHGATSTSNSQGADVATAFVDGQLAGDVNALRNIQAFQVGAIRYYNVTEAGARFGIRAGTSGAIEVVMRSPTQP
jgi:hypothetical protein